MSVLRGAQVQRGCTGLRIQPVHPLCAGQAPSQPPGEQVLPAKFPRIGGWVKAPPQSAYRERSAGETCAPVHRAVLAVLTSGKRVNRLVNRWAPNLCTCAPRKRTAPGDREVHRALCPHWALVREGQVRRHPAQPAPNALAVVLGARVVVLPRLRVPVGVAEIFQGLGSNGRSDTQNPA